MKGMSSGLDSSHMFHSFNSHSTCELVTYYPTFSVEETEAWNVKIFIRGNIESGFGHEPGMAGGSQPDA
jgi:hypothetical protein